VQQRSREIQFLALLIHDRRRALLSKFFRKLAHLPGLENLGFFKKTVFSILGFLGFNLGYEDRTQNYDPEIHEEYLIHDTPIPLPHRADYSIRSYKHN